MASTDDPLVLVTGISGYIGSWVAFLALKLGYRVRGTVRSLANEKKVKHLRNLCEGAKHELELVEADLVSEKGWDEAVKDVTFILHVASPFPLRNPETKEEVVGPAVDGTLRVLRAASRLVIPPKRVIVTSSAAAVYPGHDHRGKVFTDDTWAIMDDPKYTVNYYIESKYLAERAAWDFVNNLPAEKKFELATINPTYVFGPVLSSSEFSSGEIISNLLLGKTPAVVDINLEIVSVQDVAKAHLLAMVVPEAAGKRFLLSSFDLSLKEASTILVKEYGSKGYKPTITYAPSWLLRIASPFLASARDVLSMLGVRRDLRPVNAETILGLHLDDDKEKIVVSMINSAIAAGIIEDKSSDQQITKAFKKPDIDITNFPRY